MASNPRYALHLATLRFDADHQSLVARCPSIPNEFRIDGGSCLRTQRNPRPDAASHDVPLLTCAKHNPHGREHPSLLFTRPAFQDNENPVAPCLGTHGRIQR
jgi:hypothetical protein